MENKNYSHRIEVANYINNLYKNREHSQKDIAEMLGISENQVSKVTRKMNYEHTLMADAKDFIQDFRDNELAFLDSIKIPD